MTERRLGLIDISRNTQVPVIQWIDGPLVIPQWRLWTSYNRLLSLGTFIRLGDNGTMTRIVINPDYTQSEVNIP